MEMTNLHRRQTAHFATAVVFLAAMLAGLGVVCYLTLQASASADPQVKRVLARLAWVSFALLGSTLVVLFWVIIHFIVQRLREPLDHTPTPYVDAWALAGQRVKPIEEDQDEDEQEDAPGEK